MNYEEIRAKASTGDPIGCYPSGIFGKIITTLTKEAFSHVALFVWHGTGLWVYEFVEGRGYQCMPASQWFELRKEQRIFVGKAPECVRRQPESVLKAVSSFRASGMKQHYGIVSLARIFFAQIFKQEIKTVFKVCSTFIEFVWGQAGYKFSVTPDPGDVMKVAAQFGDIYEVPLGTF